MGVVDQKTKLAGAHLVQLTFRKYGHLNMCNIAIRTFKERNDWDYCRVVGFSGDAVSAFCQAALWYIIFSGSCVGDPEVTDFRPAPLA